MIFDYNATRTFADTLQVDDPGNCAIRCEGIYYEGKIPCYGEYYLITKTVMGKTSVLKFGPVVADLPYALNSFDASFKQFKYKEATIEKEIKLFINDGKKGITKAEEVLDLDAFNAYPSMQDTFDNL